MIMATSNTNHYDSSRSVFARCQIAFTASLAYIGVIDLPECFVVSGGLPNCRQPSSGLPPGYDASDLAWLAPGRHWG
jgi:hypothetical protein